MAAVAGFSVPLRWAWSVALVQAVRKFFEDCS